MTLSLDDVRNKRFRMARRSGYEVLEVDEFVDEVEVTIEQLTEENQNLKKQIEALKETPAADLGDAATATGPAEPETIVVTTGAEASSAVVRLVTLSTEQAERLVSEATAEAATIRDEAAASAQQVTGDAQARAERIQAEAQQNADRLRTEAQSRAASLDTEIAERRTELLDGLTAERDELQIAVGQLRTFEAGFRANLANHLREHITALESGHAEPYEVPALADSAAVADAEQRAATLSEESQPTDEDESDGGGQEEPSGESAGDSVFPDDDPAEAADSTSSETPRLNALLGDQR